LVDGRVAMIFIAGGVAGGLAGAKLSVGLAERRVALARGLAVAVACVAAFVLWRSAPALIT